MKDGFLKVRKTGIGGSDIGAIMGENKNKSAYEVYLDKTEEVEIQCEDNEPIVWGNLLEDPISTRYEQLTNKEQIFVTDTFRHPKYPFLIAHPDRIMPIEKKGLEIKTAGFMSRDLWGESGSQQIPTHYYLQIAHYMLVLDYDSWDIAVLIGGQELRIYTFERLKEADDIILENGINFWENHVLKRNPPTLENINSKTVEFLKKRYKLVSPEIVPFGDNLFQWRDIWLEAKELVKRYQNQVDIAQAHLLEAMKEAGRGNFSDGSSFVRKLVKAKEYMVKEREYVRFEFRKGG
jgi:putative phage-type endonuclease